MRRHWWSLPVPQEKSLLFEDNIFSSSLRGREVLSVYLKWHMKSGRIIYETHFSRKHYTMWLGKKHTRTKEFGGGNNNNTISWISLRPVWRRGFRALPSVSHALCKAIYHSFVPFLWIWQAAIFVWFLKHPPNNKSSSWWVSEFVETVPWMDSVILTVFLQIKDSRLTIHLWQQFQL